MANPVKGEVGFEAGGTKYRFVLGSYGLAALERKSGKKTPEFFSVPVKDWGMEEALAVFWAGLLRYHDLSEQEASDLMDEIGDKAGVVLGEGLLLAFGQKEKKAGPDRPTKKARSGAGTNS